MLDCDGSSCSNRYALDLLRIATVILHIMCANKRIKNVNGQMIVHVLYSVNNLNIG